MTRCGYLIRRLLCDIGSLLTRGANAIFFGGSTAQGLSSRAYLNGRDSEFWRRFGVLINTVFSGSRTTSRRHGKTTSLAPDMFCNVMRA
jgi:hypothetical protein